MGQDMGSGCVSGGAFPFIFFNSYEPRGVAIFTHAHTFTRVTLVSNTSEFPSFSLRRISFFEYK